MEENVLKLKDVSSNSFSNVNIEVEKGEFLVIFAPSGSGKTTLLNLICRLESLVSGQIFIEGRDISDIDDFDKWRASNIGYVYEEYNLIKTLTLYENVGLPMVAAKLAKEKRKDRVSQAIEKVGLKGKEGLYPKKLNMEEEQRVALARAIACEPVIILADEPTGKLNSGETESYLGLLTELNKETGNTFIVATHDQRIKTVASKVLEL